MYPHRSWHFIRAVLNLCCGKTLSPIYMLMPINVAKAINGGQKRYPVMESTFWNSGNVSFEPKVLLYGNQITRMCGSSFSVGIHQIEDIESGVAANIDWDYPCFSPRNRSLGSHLSLFTSNNLDQELGSLWGRESMSCHCLLLLSTWLCVLCLFVLIDPDPDTQSLIGSLKGRLDSLMVRHATIQITPRGIIQVLN